MANISDLFMNYDDFLDGAKQCLTFAKIERGMYIERLKETYSSAYLIGLGYSAEELDSVGSSAHMLGR